MLRVIVPILWIKSLLLLWVWVSKIAFVPTAHVVLVGLVSTVEVGSHVTLRKCLGLLCGTNYLIVNFVQLLLQLLYFIVFVIQLPLHLSWLAPRCIWRVNYLVALYMTELWFLLLSVRIQLRTVVFWLVLVIPGSVRQLLRSEGLISTLARSCNLLLLV